MDFEGRSDGRSIKSIISHVAPLKLVCDSLLSQCSVVDIMLFVHIVHIDSSTFVMLPLPCSTIDNQRERTSPSEVS